jgi:hypothetical protein
MDLENSFKVALTKNYKLFKFLDNNRDPNQKIFSKLLKSIAENGIQIPVVVNKDFQIIDGQHRFWALKKLGYKIPYIISKTWKEDKHTIEINNTGSKWSAMDFANYAAESGNTDVAEAIKIAIRWEKETAKRLRPTTALEILMESRSHAGLLSKLKKLTYKIDRDRGMQVYDSLNEMSKHKMKASPFSSKIARAIKVLNFDYNDLDEEIIQLMCNENYIQNFNKENDQLEYLRDIYDEAAVKLKVKNI